MNEEQPMMYNSDLEVFEALLNKAGIKYTVIECSNTIEIDVGTARSLFCDIVFEFNKNDKTLLDIFAGV